MSLPAAAAALRAHPRIVVACHEAPDGDALGSLIGCGRTLRDNGWDVVLWAPGDALLPADYRWLGYDDLVRTAPADLSERLLLTLDCGSALRLGEGGEAWPWPPVKHKIKCVCAWSVRGKKSEKKRGAPRKPA